MKTKIEKLADKIFEARDKYYNHQPIMSDAAFDKLVEELAELDPNHSAITTIGAPVIVSEWKKVTHEVAMTSLNKVNTADEFRLWAQSCGATQFLLCEKLDGISVSTKWMDGKFVQAATRGNSIEGEDITVNVARMKGIPKKLKKNFSGHLRGEILLKKSDHQKYFSDYANPRNAASGIAKRLDGVGVEHLTVMMYKVEGKDFKTELDQFEFLSSLGVIATQHTLCFCLQDVLDVYELYSNKKRQHLDWDIDGLVLRVNDLAKQEALGELNKRPKGQIAYKFAADAKETILRNIVWQVGNSGRITPVGEFDPVQLMGAEVKRASLYNLSYIKDLGLDVGAKVILIRANDVIPRCEEVSKSTGTVAKAPSKCPECQAPTQMNGEYLICVNKAGCPAQKLGRLMTWVAELNILDWSEKTLERLIEAGLVTDVNDLYKLKPDQLKDLDRMGEKLAKKLVDIMDKHREIPLQNLIGGLGIDGVATSTSKLVVDAGYDTVDAFLGMTVADFRAIPGFGDIRAQAFHDGLKANKKRIQNILAAGVKVKAKPKGTLTGRSFCFTGASALPRAQLHKLVEEAGGDVKKSVGRGLNFLVMADADSTSSKAQAAKKLGTQIISEEDFMKML